ncbi:MAG: diguanylate cyclase domain-containing protein [Anaerolineales bacterium]
MNPAILVLVFEAMAFYLLVLGAHSLRDRFGLAHFYALLGGITAIMSWVTDAGAQVQFAGITFMIGSTVFYTSLLLGVFVIYVFDGPAKARIAISTVFVVSILMPLVAALLHAQADLLGQTSLDQIPEPSLRINAASVIATFCDLIFLGIAWEILGKQRARISLWLRTYLTLLGVLILDVLLFNPAAFLGTPDFMSIMQGTLLNRLVVSAFAMPFLYGYIRSQSDKSDVTLVNRPVLAILNRFFQLEEALDEANVEIERRRQAEVELELALQQLEASRREYKRLNEELHLASTVDALTSIANRRKFDEILQKEWRRGCREEFPISMLLMDVDGFKGYNDRHGHLEGDKMLQLLARELSSQFRRPADLLARYGGDEFVAILPNTDEAGAATVASNCCRLLASLEFMQLQDDDRPAITLSIGVATMIPLLDQEPVRLIERADQALYQAKRQGGGRVVTLSGGFDPKAVSG